MCGFGICKEGSDYLVVCDFDDIDCEIARFSELSDAIELIHYLNGGASNIMKRFEF